MPFVMNGSGYDESNHGRCAIRWVPNGDPINDKPESLCGECGPPWLEKKRTAEEAQRRQWLNEKAVEGQPPAGGRLFHHADVRPRTRRD